MLVKPIASGSTGNAYLVTDGRTTLLLDAGVSVKALQAATGYKLSSISACAITHKHGDHSKAAADLAKRGIDIYAPEDTIAACRLTGNHRGHVMQSQEEILIGTIALKAFDVKHDVSCYGYMLTSGSERLVYITDAQYCRYRFPHVTHWILETNFSEEQARENVSAGIITQEYKNRIWQAHMSFGQAEQLLKANDLTHTKQIFLAHMSEKNAREDDFIKRVQELTGAEVYAC